MPKPEPTSSRSASLSMTPHLSLPWVGRRLGILVSAAVLLFTALCGFAAQPTQPPPPPLPPLTTVSGSPRLPGKFVWADLVTDDVAAARKFYGHVFNWTFRDLGNYT